MTRKTFPTVLDHSGLGIMNVIPYVIHPGATLTMEIVKVSSAAVARLTKVPLFSRTIFNGGGSSHCCLSLLKFGTYYHLENFKLWLLTKINK